jgi:hypothetical protein
VLTPTKTRSSLQPASKMTSPIPSLATLVDDVFLLIIEQLLDEEDPALVSTSNKHRRTVNEQFPREFSKFN